MATPIEQLDDAYGAAREAKGQAFFRRLRDYLLLVRDDRRIRRAADSLDAEVEEAGRIYGEEDDDLVHELVDLRDDLVALAPATAEDAEAEHPGRREPFDPAEAERWRSWALTLANFDAIAAGREERMLEEREGDRSRSRGLGEILRAKVYDLQYPDDPNRKERADLDPLRTKLDRLRDRQRAAQLRYEAVAESTGHIARLNLSHVLSHTSPREPRPDAPRGSEEQTVWINEIFAESVSGFAYLRELMRPRELRGALNSEAMEAIGRIEGRCRDALERLHPPLRRRLEDKRIFPSWGDFTRNEKIGIIGVVLTGLSVIVAIVIALSATA